MFEVFRKVMLAGFGAQEKLSELVDELVKKGELNESQGARLVREWTEKAEENAADMNKGFSDLVASAVERLRIPTPDDFKALEGQVKELSARLKALEDKLSA